MSTKTAIEQGDIPINSRIRPPCWIINRYYRESMKAASMGALSEYCCDEQKLMDRTWKAYWANAGDAMLTAAIFLSTKHQLMKTVAMSFLPSEQLTGLSPCHPTRRLNYPFGESIHTHA